MPLFADGTPDPQALGTFIQLFFYVCGGLGGLALIVSSVYSMVRREQNLNSAFVTRAEMTAELTRLEAEIKELRTYTRDRTHDLGNRMHVINLRIVYMMGLLSQICAKQGIAVPPEPTVSPRDET